MLILMNKKRARTDTHGSKNGHAKNYNAGDITHSKIIPQSQQTR